MPEVLSTLAYYISGRGIFIVVFLTQNSNFLFCPYSRLTIFFFSFPRGNLIVKVRYTSCGMEVRPYNFSHFWVHLRTVLPAEMTGRFPILFLPFPDPGALTVNVFFLIWSSWKQCTCFLLQHLCLQMFSNFFLGRSGYYDASSQYYSQSDFQR